jgi:hypothetical protein
MDWTWEKRNKAQPTKEHSKHLIKSSPDKSILPGAHFHPSILVVTDRADRISSIVPALSDSKSAVRQAAENDALLLPTQRACRDTMNVHP